MFNKENRYVTKGVNENLDIRLQIMIWNLINELKEQIEVDYLQVFNISQINKSRIKITQEQEVPEYKAEYEIERKDFTLESDVKIYVIDDGEYSTMILEEEY
jgi:ABC-type dipeptide/oligopeptide/nickel transport system ATPase subunit